MKTFVAALFSIAFVTFAQDLSPRHNESGTVGPNGVKQTVDLKIMKNKTGTDKASIQLDLGENKYDGTKADKLINLRPTIILQLGATLVFKGVADKKGKITGQNFTGKLINNGKGISIDLKKADLSALKAELLGKGEHAPLTITIKDNHAETKSAGRHEGELFEAVFELDVDETKMSIVARG